METNEVIKGAVVACDTLACYYSPFVMSCYSFYLTMSCYGFFSLIIAIDSTVSSYNY